MPKPLSKAQLARNRVGGAVRRGDPAAVEQARRDMADATLETRVREAVDAAPPLTDAQRVRLAALFLDGGSDG